MPNNPIPIGRNSFDAQTLMINHPPKWRNRNKLVAFERAFPAGSIANGTIAYSRWNATPLPQACDVAGAASIVVTKPGFFDYLPEVDGAVEWHVNFADDDLFVAYAGNLLAQDELQVLEHPALASLLEALTAEQMRTVTRENGTPTPVLVTGVERRCSLATNPNDAESRPRGLYGNQFAMTPEDAVRRAITPLEPPTISNIIAIAAPRGGWGRYAADEIEHILVTAYSGFRAAVEESKRLGGGPVVIHTGWWGCGAFGGNRDLMAILQVLAARLAGVNRLAFHTGDDEGEADLERALNTLRSLEFAADASTSHELIQKIWEQGYRWGVSNGT